MHTGCLQKGHFYIQPCDRSAHLANAARLGSRRLHHDRNLRAKGFQDELLDYVLGEKQAELTRDTVSIWSRPL